MAAVDQLLKKHYADETKVAKPLGLFAGALTVSSATAFLPVLQEAKPYTIRHTSGTAYSATVVKFASPVRRQYQPKTALGKKLVALRERAISKGMQLLDANGVAAEVKERRGETG